MSVSFIGGGNCSTWGNLIPSACHWQTSLLMVREMLTDLVHLVLLEHFVGDRADQPLIALSFLYYTCVCSVFILSPGHAFTLMGTRQLGPRTTRTETSRPASEDKSARTRGIFGLYVKTTWTVWKDYSDHE